MSFSQVKIYRALEDTAACAFMVLFEASDSSKTYAIFKKNFAASHQIRR
jgi:hypothetical protein